MLNFRGLFRKVRSRGSNSNTSLGSRNSNDDFSSKEASPLSYFQEDESTRAWGDELSGDLLYTIILRRVRYSKNSDEGLQWETQKVRLLKAGSLERLVDHLAAAFLHDDVNFLSIFLATYRTFVPPQQVLDMLLNRYENLTMEERQRGNEPSGDSNESFSASDCDAIKKSILRVLELWIERHPEDWQQPPKFPLVQKTLTFCNSHRSDGDDLEKKTRRVLSDARKKRNTANPGLSIKTSKEHDLDRTSVNKEAALYFLRHLAEDELARSLLAYDVRLFRRVIPWQCLGSVWSRRGTGAEISTVKATVKQFNHVVYIVLATVLSPCLSLQQRAKIVEKWIKVAEESRERKNFSSLRAIVSGLQTHAVHRLKRTWEAVSSQAKLNFEKLHEEMKSECKSDHESSSVPYLGTFLHDLMMLDTAHADFLESGRLINFEKRRKEFELLTMISLLQMGCEKHEREKPSDEFQKFISLVQPLTDDQGFELSQMAEGGKYVEYEPAKYGSLLQHSFSTLMDDSEDDTISESRGSSQADLLDLRMRRSPRSSCVSAKSTGKVNNNILLNGNFSEPTSPVVSSCRQSQSNPVSPRGSVVESVIVRVYIEDQAVKNSGVNYRCIRVTEHDRVKQVLSLALTKHNLLEEVPSNWNLAQKLAAKELPLPDNANVFHAIDKSQLKDGEKMIEFIIRRKTSEEIHETEKNQRLKRSKLYAQTGLSLTLPAGTSATSNVVFNDAKLSRHESLAQKIGSVSMANLGKDDIRDPSFNSIKSKSAASVVPR